MNIRSEGEYNSLRCGLLRKKLIVRAQKQVISVYTSISADSSASSIGRFSSYERNRGRDRLNSSNILIMSSRVSLEGDANCVGAISFVLDGGVDQAGATMKTTFKLPHTRPVALASAPLQTAMIAAKSFICGRINSRRLNDDSLFLPGNAGPMAFAWASSSSTLSTSRIASPSLFNSEWNRSRACDRSGR